MFRFAKMSGLEIGLGVVVEGSRSTFLVLHSKKTTFHPQDMFHNCHMEGPLSLQSHQNLGAQSSVIRGRHDCKLMMIHEYLDHLMHVPWTPQPYSGVVHWTHRQDGSGIHEYT